MTREHLRDIAGRLEPGLRRVEEQQALVPSVVVLPLALEAVGAADDRDYVAEAFQAVDRPAMAQRPAQLGVKLYQKVGTEGDAATCVRCGQPFASRMHIDDLKLVLPQLGFDYTMPGPAGNWQEICPACKRKALSVAQLRLKEEARG